MSKKYDVTIIRTDYRAGMFAVEAEDKETAVKLALEQAKNTKVTDWNVGTPDYEVEDVQEAK